MGSTDVRRLRTAGVTALACLLLLAGCGGDDPAPLVADPPASPSATPTPTASAAPEPWEERSKAGAVAFVEHWVEVFNEAGASGDTTNLARVSGPDCTTCDQLIDQIRQLRAEGVRVQSSGWRVIASQAVEQQKRPPFDVAVRVERPPQRVLRADGTVERFPGSTQTYSARVAWNGSAWLVDRFNQIA